MGHLIVETPLSRKVSFHSADECKEILHNESTQNDVNAFDAIDGMGVLEDSVFENGDPQSDTSFSQLRETVLRALFMMLAVHLVIFTAMVGVAVFVEDVRHFLLTYRIVAYIAFLLPPIVHCIAMLCSPARSPIVLVISVCILGYVEAALSCIYDTYCIFITNAVCLATCAEALLLSIVGVPLSSSRTLALVVFLHIVNFAVITVTLAFSTPYSWVDFTVAAVAATFLPAVIGYKIRRIITHFSPSNYV